MKSYFFLLCLLVASFGAVSAQNGLESAKTDFSKRYSEVANATWQVSGEAPRVVFQEEGHLRTVLYDALGFWNGEKISVASNAIEAKVQEKLTSDFPNANILDAQNVNKGDGEIYYEIKLNQNGSNLLLKIDLDGKLLSREEL